MLFTQLVFHLECLLLFQIKSQPGVGYKSTVYKKAITVAFKSSTNEEITLPHWFIFVFIQYFIEGYCQKSLAKSGGSEKI